MPDVTLQNDADPAHPAGPVLTALDGRSIVLVGMMGVGKSSVGRRLAVRLSIPFVDADSEIENAAKMTFRRFSPATASLISAAARPV